MGTGVGSGAAGVGWLPKPPTTTLPELPTVGRWGRMGMPIPVL